MYNEEATQRATNLRRMLRHKIIHPYIVIQDIVWSASVRDRSFGGDGVRHEPTDYAGTATTMSSQAPRLSCVR